MKWLDEAQEWVWMDAVKVGPRVYHASCHSEATRDRESTPGPSRDTPEPVLGKRKAEVSLSPPSSYWRRSVRGIRADRPQAG